MTQLNPNAPEFVPQSLVDNHLAYEAYHWEENDTEQEPSQEELDELEAVEAWVDLMVEMDIAETEHLIAYALQVAPAAAQVIEDEALSEHKREHQPRKGQAPSKE